VDISTGHFFAQKVSEEKLLDEILRLSPAECLLPDSRGQLFEKEDKKLARQISELTSAVITERPGWYFDSQMAKNKLLKHFSTATLEGFGITEKDPIIPPAGAVLEYLSETQKTALNHIRSIKKIEQKNYLHIDATSLQSLEILRTIRSQSKKGSLLDCIDMTLTGMGARMFRNWLCAPLCDCDEIVNRQDLIQELIEKQDELNGLRTLLSDISDLERIAARVSTFRASPKDLLALSSTLEAIPQLKQMLLNFQSPLAFSLGENCDRLELLWELLDSAIDSQCPAHLREGGVIKSGFSEKLDELREIAKGGKKWLIEYQKSQMEKTGIANLKVGFNKVFGYYIEINHSQVKNVPSNYTRKQTLKNAERYITEELKQFENKVLDAREKSIELENHLFENVRKQTAEYIPRIQKLADIIANTDCLCSLAHLARTRNYIRPEITDEKSLDIKEGAHPVLKETLGSEFVSNDTQLGNGKGDVIIITGPNMSGKSTYIRQNALLVIMAQTGSFIPAESARIGLVDRIFTRVGASDELIRGQSTFMVEMTETANILNNATEKSLIILDEIGRGTSTYDGLSLAWAITEYLAAALKSRTLFATHYHELTELQELFENVKNCNVAVREWMDEVVFLHKILPGGTDKSYGIHVAKLAGVPVDILERSKEILRELENTFTKEAACEKLSKRKTRKNNTDLLFVQKHKPVLEKLSKTDIDNLTPIQAINLLSEIKKEIDTVD
jgi:DNA mismatch repair protein MutS